MSFQGPLEIQLSGILGFSTLAIAWLYGGIVLYRYIKTYQKVLFFFSAHYIHNISLVL